MTPAAPGPAPVALFGYRRPEHLRLTVESLRANAQAGATHLTVFCDAARSPEHADAVAAVRAYADAISGFASVTVVKREHNLGLARSIIDGVTRLCEAHGRVIVVEDDLLLSPHFLRYMNDGLALYEGDAGVASIHGYCYPVADPLPETFFLRGADCWGWATWQRAWSRFEPDGARLLSALQARSLTHAFDLDGQYGFTRMLGEQIAGRNDSWAVRWHATCFLEGLLTLYPGRSLVHNLGNDASGTHCGRSSALDQVVATSPVRVERIPTQENATARRAVIRFLHAGRSNVLTRSVVALRRLLEGSR
jgi:hypothetical protein